jgi:hypothetical protein
MYLLKRQDHTILRTTLASLGDIEDLLPPVTLWPISWNVIIQRW